MKLELLKPAKSLNKAYLKQDLKRNQIELFKSNLNILFSRANEADKKKESEEHFKNLIADFLKDTFYKSQNEVNTSGRKDLVIHNGKSSADSVGVIIEAKQPSNHSEMISERKPNSKALHQLLHYYLYERYIKDNKEIKHLIVTNIYEWFVFDGAEFEKFFFENPILKKQYKEWNDGLFGLKQTDWLYQEVTKPFIEQELGKLTCTYFNLKDVENLIQKKEQKEDKRLLDLYKILSPEHLLKKSFVNDSNTLNKDFYNELLHIIGLSETNDKGKKVIKRKEEEKQDEGSLLENTINILRVRNKLSVFENPKQFGETEEQQLFSIGLELCITWLNRILFLKLLEGQLIKYHKYDKTFSFLNFQRITDFDEANELFFEVLAVPVSKRTKSVKDKFGNLPYLNSSLFEETELEIKTLVIADIKDRLEIPVLSSTVLKEESGKKISGKKNTLQYLFEFLDAYDFSSDSSAEIQEQNKTIINASVLGLIFEKINGYKDGSFFTPGFITMYMCRETIRMAVIQKFNTKHKWTCNNFNELYNKLEKVSIEEANETINDLKICDPAVGSGHFLVSALNEIISIKNDLEILVDSEGKRLKGYSIVIENDELIITQEDEIFEYNYKDKESQRIQETLFHEKQNLIENCLFGVDINPKSVMICRLRLWIELLKNAYYTKASDYNELETLPNIDINIKCGNSLISRFALDDDLSKALKSIKYSIADYRGFVADYKNEKNREVKRGLQKIIDGIKNDFVTQIRMTDPRKKRLDKLLGELYQRFTGNMLFESEQEYGNEKKIKANKEKGKLEDEIEKISKELENVKKNAIYENAFEWRFEFPEILNNNGDFEGFDIVIGNPPYFSLSKDERNEYYKVNYTTFNSSGDIYCLFYELSNKILSNNGFLSFITSNKWMRATYGKELREYLIQNTNPYFLFDFGWFQVFDNASVDTNILCFQKANYNSNLKASSAQQDFKLESLSVHANQNLTTIQVSRNNYWNVVSSVNQDLKIKIETRGKKLEEWSFQINRGIVSGLNEAFQINTATKDALIKKEKKNAEILVPLLRGRDIERYSYNFANIYLINTYNGFLATIKNPDKNIKEKNGTYSYKPEKSKKWFAAKRIEHTRGKYYRINRIIVETDYPSVFEHMQQFEEALKKREDQGDHWTNLRNCTYDEQFKTDKLVWAETMRVHKTGNRNFPRFGFDNKNHYTDKTVFIGVGKHLKYLLAVFNSSVGKWLIKEYVTKLDTGGYMMQKVFLDKIPIIEPDELNEKQIEKIIDEILNLKQLNFAADTTMLEKKIDALIYQLFNISEEEQKIIEET